MEDSSKADFKMPVMIRDVKTAQHDAFRKGLDDLLDLFRQHAQMQANPHDGRTPTALFFAWDFIQRTRRKLSQIPAEKLESNDEDALEQYSDCVGRAIMAEMIVAGKTPVAARMRGGELVDFGYEIRKAAKAAAVAGGGEEGRRHV